MPERDTLLSQAPRPAKAILALALMACLLPAPVRAAKRLLWTAPLLQLKDMALAPLDWEPATWACAPLALAVVGGLAPLDPGLRDQMRGRHGMLDATMPLMSEVGEGWVLALATAAAWGGGALAGSDKLQEACAVTLQALAVSGLLTPGLKLAIGSVRPSSLGSEHRYFDYQRPYGQLSSPSGHSFSAFAAAEAFGAYYGRWWTYPLAAAIAYSRVYEGAHWPSDIAAGAVLGLITGHLAVASSQQEGAPTLLWSARPGFNGQNLAISVKF